MKLGQLVIPDSPPDRGHQDQYAPLLCLSTDGTRKLMMRKVKPMSEIENTMLEPIQGKFPYLQEDLRQKLNAAHQRCVDAARLIQRAAEERAEMYEQMVDESKAALVSDREYFKKMEG